MFKTLKSILAGIVAGTAVGILFAPKKGKDLRKNLKAEINKGGTGLSTVKETFTEMGKDIGGTCKECYDDVSKTEEFKKGKEKFKQYANTAKKELGKVIKKNVSKKTLNKAKKTLEEVKRKLK
ncbi:YtxH domain-containing protein [Candidatus Peregrinibacteria bacterium]|nr:YtxH domain-containing protein [Candidatus Peregrinibacteria bacterium]